MPFSLLLLVGYVSHVAYWRFSTGPARICDPFSASLCNAPPFASNPRNCHDYACVFFIYSGTFNTLRWWRQHFAIF